jgi:hypothetical protein
MKLTSTILLSLALAFPISPTDTDVHLDAWYNSYNHQYFNGELPEAGTLSPPDVIIDFHLSDPKKLGITIFGEADGYIRMSFNPDYIKSQNTLKMTMLHEQCHIELFVEDIHTLDDHGPEWQACMLRLAEKGAFHDLW